MLNVQNVRAYPVRGKPMGDRVQQAASQIGMKDGETVSITFADDRPHNGHSDAYIVTRSGDSYKATKDHS